MKDIANDPELKKSFDQTGIQIPADISPAYAAKFVDEERERWATVIKAGELVVK